MKQTLALLFIALLACASLSAQTKINPERDLTATPTDSVLINLGGTAPAIIRGLICADRTGATCPDGSLYVDAGLRLTAKTPPPAAGLRRRCQDDIVTTGNVAQVVLTITEASYVLVSVDVFVNGLRYSRTTAPNFVPDYVVTGQTITINRQMSTGSVIGLCYNY